MVPMTTRHRWWPGTVTSRLFLVQVRNSVSQRSLRVVLERRALADDERHRVAVVQLAVLLQRRQRHVVEGEQREDQERQQQQVHQRSSPRSGRRATAISRPASARSGAGPRPRRPAAGRGRARSPRPRRSARSRARSARQRGEEVGRVDRPAVGEHVDDVEVAEGEDRREEHHDGEHRLEQRQGDVPEARASAPAPSASAAS